MTSHPADPATAVEQPRVRAAWLHDNLLLVFGALDGAGGADLQAHGTNGAVAVTPIGTGHSYRPALPGYSSERRMLVCRLPAHANGRGPVPAITLMAGDTSLSIPGAASRAQPSDLVESIKSEAALVDAVTREELLEFLLKALAADLDAPEGQVLGSKLRALRNILRASLPKSLVRPDESLHVHVDRVLALDHRSFWVEGWLWDPGARATRMTIVSAEGARGELLDRAFRRPRPDVESTYAGMNSPTELGFVCFVSLPVPSRWPTDWLIEAADAGGTAVEAEVPDVVSDPEKARDVLLYSVGLEPLHSEDLKPNHIRPAMSKLQKRLASEVEVEAVVQYGTAADSPPATIVVPLYSRGDLLEFQLAQFVHDPQIRGADLLYVVDSPELTAEVSAQAPQLYEIYRVPYRLMTLSRNVGYAGANNAGVSAALADKVLLLNSDVMPDRPGWLGEMIEFYDGTPNIGALGPKLLYEDDSLQHAGMYFWDPSLLETAAYSGSQAHVVWENGHYFKGLSRWVPAANVARRVPAVTGACLMIDKALYESVGGLPGKYVGGGYEDSDLCLQLLRQGRDNWYLPSVELYHLEGQSYTWKARELTTRHNMWLQSYEWRQFIEDVMKRPEFSSQLPAD